MDTNVSLDRIRLGDDLRHAVKGGQLALVFQPKVSLADGDSNAAEALLRWNHPRHGSIAPSRFVPLAERMGLIGAMTDWVRRRAPNGRAMHARNALS